MKQTQIFNKQLALPLKFVKFHIPHTKTHVNFPFIPHTLHHAPITAPFKKKTRVLLLVTQQAL